MAGEIVGGSHDDIAQPDVFVVVCVVRHAPAHTHNEDIVHCLECAQEPGGGAAGGNARLKRTQLILITLLINQCHLSGVASHWEFSHHTPVSSNVS